jgi:hypothetical protein
VKKTPIMGASHEIYLSIKDAQLKDNVTTIQIKKNGKKSGRIELNKSRLLYYPKGSNKCYDVYWNELEEAIISYCKKRGNKRSLMLLPKELKESA